MTIGYLKRIAQLYGMKNPTGLQHVQQFIKFLESKEAVQKKLHIKSSEPYDMRGLEQTLILQIARDILYIYKQ